MENDVMSEEFLEKAVSYMAYLPMGAFLDEESKALLKLFEENEKIETSEGFIWGFNTGITHYNKETDSIRAEMAVKSCDQVACVLKELLEKAGVKSVVGIPGRALDFSFESFHEFADGVLTDSESRNYYDNGTLDSGEETFVEKAAQKHGVDLEQIAYDDPEVFTGFLDKEIIQWSYVFRSGDEDGLMAGFVPKSFDDLMVYFVALMGAGGEDNLDFLKEYMARRDGLKPVPENIPEELKGTFGMVAYHEQEKFAEDGVPALPYPLPQMVAKLNCKSTYQFVYLCKKFGVHKDLK